MKVSGDGRNREIYNRPDVASHYADLDYLTPCEQFLFDLYIKPKTSVLDLGVGGGRTTPYLAQRASRYVGLDYAVEMIRLCRHKYPELEFVEAEASDLSAFDAGSFEAIVFAFNGMDYVIPDGKRQRCLEECFRMLKPGGVLVFSSHNPHYIFAPPAWNRQRVRDLAGKFAGPDSVGRFALTLLTFVAWTFASLRAGWKSIARGIARIPRRAFWRGEGYLFDAAHGGLLTHCWIPRLAIAELEKRGFQFEKAVGNDYPQVRGEYSTDWYYYVFSKPNSVGSGEICA